MVVINEKNVFGKIMNPIISMVEETENSIPNDSKNYKLSFFSFTVNILFGIINGIKSISLLVTEIETSDIAHEFGLPNASKSMYSEAFVRYNPELFKLLFYQLLASVSFLSIPEIMHLGQFMLIDGSLFPAISTMQWASYKSTANAIKLHVSFNLNKMIPVEFLAREGNYSEKKFLTQILKEGITYICDRGYISFTIFKDICNKGAFFIIRGKNKMCYTVQDNLTVDVPNQFLNFISEIIDIKVIFNNDKYKKSYRIVKFTAMGELYVLITNRFDLTTYEIIMLYAYRWQIELYFRFIKRTLKCIHLMTHDSNGIQIQFYLYMIAYILLLVFKQECEIINDNSKINDKNKNMDELHDVIKSSTRRPYVRGLVSMLGKGLQKYWKIGLHWLKALRNSFLKNFDINIAIALANFT